MRLQLFKGATELKIISCRLNVWRLSVMAYLETPTNLKAGDKLELRLSTGDKLSLEVTRNTAKDKYEAVLETMLRLDERTLISASPNTPMSRIAQSEFSGVLEGVLKKDYTSPNLAFSGSLWEFLGLIERKTESEASLTKTGIAFDAPVIPLKAGKLLVDSLNSDKRKLFTLGESFLLLPAGLEGQAIEQLIYDFPRGTLEVSL